MSTVINIHINTDDLRLVARIGAIFNGATAAPAAVVAEDTAAQGAELAIADPTVIAHIVPPGKVATTPKPSAKERAQKKVKDRAPAAVDEAPAAETLAPVTLTQKDVSDAITNLSRKKTLPIAANIVKTTLISAEGEPDKFAVRVGDIPPSKYAEVLTRIQEALGDNA